MEPQRLIQRIFLSLWVLLMPFWDFGAGMALAIAFVAAYWPGKERSHFNLAEKRAHWPLWGIVGMVLFGSIWHPIPLDYLIRFLPLVLIYWVFDRKIIIKMLPLGSMVVVLYLLGHGCYRLLKGEGWSVFVYSELVEGLHQHVYIGTYLLLGGMAVQMGMHSNRIKGIFWTCILLFLGLLGAKTLVLGASLAGIWVAYRARKIPRWMRFAGGFLLLGFATSQTLSEGRALGHVVKPLDPYWATGSVDTRAVQAKAAFKVIAVKPWLGWGPMEKQAALENVYTEWNYRFGLKRHLNVHNQFIEWVLTFGLLGIILAAFMVLISVPALRKLPFGVLLIYFGTLWMTESFMERAFGIALFSLSWAWMAQSKDQVNTSIFK